MKKILALLLASVLVLGLFAGCAPAGNEETKGTEAVGSETKADATEATEKGTSDVVLKVAALQSAYMDKYPDMWKEVCDAFTAETGIQVQLTTEKMLEDVIGPAFKSGNGPDFVHLATGRELALTETFIKDEALAEITDLLNITIPGESVTVGDKVGGHFGNASTNPYGDERIFLAPMFLNPCGLFYNAGLLEEKGWELPTDWDGMWELAEKAKAEGIYLFCYPTHGYLQEFFYSLVYAVGGLDLFDAVTHYEEGVWETEGGKQVLEIMYKLATYTHPDVPSQDSTADYTKNQQLILNNEAIFCPNGPWLVGEMADAPKADGFQWAMAPIPAGKPGGDRYALNWYEQCWIPASSEHVEEAKQFMAFMYSDKAAAIFAKAGAIQPVDSAISTLEGLTKEFFSIFTVPGVKSAVGGFAATEAVEGVSTDSCLFAAMNSMVSGSMTLEGYTAGVVSAFDTLRAAMK